MVRLKNSVRICNDPKFHRLQIITRMHPGIYSTIPEFSREFRIFSGILFTLTSDRISE